MKQKIFIVLTMIILLFSIFSYSFATTPLKLDIEHIRRHEQQDLFLKKRINLTLAFFILMAIIIFVFSILSKYKNIELIYTILFILLSVTWVIIGGCLIKFNTIINLIFDADSYSYESIIGLSILIELILFAINKFITNKNKSIIVCTVLITFIGYQILKIINGYEDIGKWIYILLFINLAMLPIYLSNKNKGELNENIRN